MITTIRSIFTVKKNKAFSFGKWRTGATLSILLLGCVPADRAVSGGEVLETYEVPALSPIKRLPDGLPSDVQEKGGITFVAAKGEFEPASFVIVPGGNLDKVELRASPLKGSAGEIPAENLDIKVVKTWYQDGTAWYSYFADPSRRELVPELLLNDETLIRVDHEKQGNQLRVGEEYRSISYPKEEAKTFFNYFAEPVVDAPTLQPITLRAGETKQIWVTLKVPVDAAAGTYAGTITLSQKGRTLGTVAVKARVLPFALPDPKTYYDLNRDFFVTIYSTGVLDLAERLSIPKEQALRQQAKIYENQLNHNVRNPRSEVSQHLWRKEPEKGLELLRQELTLMKEAGVVTKPLLSNEPLWLMGDKSPEAFKERIRNFREVVKDVLGHTDIYATHWDEAGYKQIREMRDEQGHRDEFPDMKWWVTTSRNKHFNLAGYLFDYANQAGWPTREQAATWHAVGGRIASYASPHTGPENPDVFRRWEGLARYKANYDGSFNYKYYSQLHPTLYEKQKANTWNDSLGGTFRSFNMVYPTKDGVIDTIAWEGFREGIDDIRYATLLKEKVRQAEASGSMPARHLGRKALMWLELTDMETADLNAVRQEMINYILKLDDLLK